MFYRARPGRSPKLTEAQRRKLRQLVVDNPEAAGYTSTCWTAGMIADLIWLRIKVDYAPRYVCHLLGQLGYAGQKGRFRADHLDDEAALPWLEET